jgi:hypothetical protein
MQQAFPSISLHGYPKEILPGHFHHAEWLWRIARVDDDPILFE